jgi:hypothetical protein
MSTRETKSFPIEVAVGTATGICLGSFSDIHECAEWVAGHSIWTHEFAERSLTEKLHSLISWQHPHIGELKLSAMRPEDVPMVVADLRSTFGETVELAKGGEERTESPIESAKRVAPHAEIIPIKAIQ